MSTPDTETPNARDVLASALSMTGTATPAAIEVADDVLKTLSDAGYTVARLKKVDRREFIIQNYPWAYRIVGSSE